MDVLGYRKDIFLYLFNEKDNILNKCIILNNIYLMKKHFFKFLSSIYGISIVLTHLWDGWVVGRGRY